MVDSVNGGNGNQNVAANLRVDPGLDIAVGTLEEDVRSLQEMAVAVVLPSIIKTQARFREALKEE